MKKVLYLALALLMASCVEVEIVNISAPEKPVPVPDDSTKCPMKISDSHPIQFYPFYGQTYNEKVLAGVQKMCYCQPAFCTVPIPFQVADVGEDDLVMLYAYDEEGVELGSYELENWGDGYAGITLTPLNEGWCDKKVSFKYTSPSPTADILIPVADVSKQLNYMAGSSWSASLTPFEKAITTMSSQYSDILYWDASPGDYELQWSFEQHDPTPGVQVKLEAVALDFALNVVYSKHIVTFVDEAAAVSVTDVSLPATTSYFGIRAEIVAGVADSRDVWVVQLDLVDGTLVSPRFRSDCVDFRESFPGCDLATIFYNGDKPYDNLYYGPDAFGIENVLLVDGTFWKDRFPEEDVTHDLSDGTMIATSSEIYTERLLMVNLLPAFMHRKIMGALKHSRVHVANVYGQDITRVTKRDKYVIDEAPNADKLEPSSAKCWLVIYDSVSRNVI